MIDSSEMDSKVQKGSSATQSPGPGPRIACAQMHRGSLGSRQGLTQRSRRRVQCRLLLSLKAVLSQSIHLPRGEENVEACRRWPWEAGEMAFGLWFRVRTP